MKNNRILIKFKTQIEHENIIRILKDLPICKPEFYTEGPTEKYRLPWRVILNNELNQDSAIICATCDDWLDIVAKNIPTNIAIDIVEEINALNE